MKDLKINWRRLYLFGSCFPLTSLHGWSFWGLTTGKSCSLVGFSEDTCFYLWSSLLGDDWMSWRRWLWSIIHLQKWVSDCNFGLAYQKKVVLTWFFVMLPQIVWESWFLVQDRRLGCEFPGRSVDIEGIGWSIDVESPGRLVEVEFAGGVKILGWIGCSVEVKRTTWLVKVEISGWGESVGCMVEVKGTGFSE